MKNLKVQIIAQPYPSNKFSVWSEMYQDFLLTDSDKNEIIQYFAEMEKERIASEVGTIIEDLKQGLAPYGNETKTFDETVDIVRSSLGDSHFTLRCFKQKGII